MISSTVLKRPTSIGSEIGYTFLNTAACAGLGAALGAARGSIVNTHVIASAAIAGLFCLLTYVPSRLMARCRQMSLKTKFMIGGLYESIVAAASIIALRHLGVIGNTGTIVLGAISAVSYLFALMKAIMVHQIEKNMRHVDANDMSGAFDYIV